MRPHRDAPHQVVRRNGLSGGLLWFGGRGLNLRFAHRGRGRRGRGRHEVEIAHHGGRGIRRLKRCFAGLVVGLSAGAGQKRWRAERAQDYDERHHACPQRESGRLFLRGGANRTIAGEESAVFALEEADAQLAFFVADERLRFELGHRRQVVNVFGAGRAKAGALVAFHRVPIGVTGRGHAHLFERNECGNPRSVEAAFHN